MAQNPLFKGITIISDNELIAQMLIEFREHIIVPLDRLFTIYQGGAGVDEGAVVDKGEECPGVVYPGSCGVLIEILNIE